MVLFLLLFSQEYKTPCILLYSAVRRSGPLPTAAASTSASALHMVPSLNIHPVDPSVFIWQFPKPLQPHIRTAAIPRRPRTFPGPDDMIAIDAEFVSTATQEVSSWLPY